MSYWKLKNGTKIEFIKNKDEPHKGSKYSIILEGDSMTTNDWKEIQKELGCFDCYFADKAALGKRACCTYCGKVEVTSNPNKCLTWTQDSKGKEPPCQ